MPLTFDQVFSQAQQTQLNTTRYSGTDASSVINSKISNNSAIQSIVYPSDLPKHHFIIYEYAVNGGTAFATRDLVRVYRLPLPSQLRDSKMVQYNTGFNIAHDAATLATVAAAAMGAKAAAAAASTLKAAADSDLASTATRLLSGGNLSLNNFNWVTLNTPEFHNWGINFVFRPKSEAESNQIRTLVNTIKTNMHPKKTSLGGPFLLAFPNIFVCSFAHPEYLYKFKPAVFTSITTEYSTTMFKVNNRSVPEYVIVSLTAKDIEVWIDKNFENQATNDPFSAITFESWYR